MSSLCSLWLAWGLLLAATPGAAAGKGWTVTVSIPPQARAGVIPVRLTLPLPLAVKPGQKVAWQCTDGKIILPTQLEDELGRNLLFLLPVAASKVEVRKRLGLNLSPQPAAPVFQFRETEGKYLHLTEGKSPVLTYNFA